MFLWEINAIFFFYFILLGIVWNKLDKEKQHQVNWCSSKSIFLLSDADNNGIKTPQPQRSIDGQLFCLVKLPQGDGGGKFKLERAL